MINNIYSLPEIDFVGGSSQDLLFRMYTYNEDGTKRKPFLLTECEANFAIINYVNKNGEPVMSKEMEKLENGDDGCNTLHVVLESADTVDLFGKFIYQITIKDVGGRAENPQGVLYIHNNINKRFLK